eukprot:6182122-Pleurochrysis_carterae.AAC.1
MRAVKAVCDSRQPNITHSYIVVSSVYNCLSDELLPDAVFLPPSMPLAKIEVVQLALDFVKLALDFAELVLHFAELALNFAGGTIK